MSNPQKKEKKYDNDSIEINDSESSLAKFTRRPLPTDEEVQQFEDYVEHEIRDEEVEDSLVEIYQDDDGEMVNVKKMQIKKKRGIFFWFFCFLFFASVLAGGAYAFYEYIYTDGGTGTAAIIFEIKAQEEVVLGEEFFCELVYENKTNVALNDLEIEIKYPEKFVFLDANPESEVEGSNIWKFDTLKGKSKGVIKIRGKLLGFDGDINNFIGNISYTPENFSSEFKKEAFVTVGINGTGLDLDFDYTTNALIGEETEIDIKLQGREDNFVNNFRLSLEEGDNYEIVGIEVDEENEELLVVEDVENGIWDIEVLSDEMLGMTVKVKFKERIEDEQVIDFVFKQVGDDGKYVDFFKKEVVFEVMKSDLNLNLIVNGSRSDQGVDFGQALNYSIVYSNKGETDLSNVVIMVVLDSDYLNWTTLDDENAGRERGNTITWTKEEIPVLSLLRQNAEGTIDFSIDMLGASSAIGGKNFQVESYVQFSIGNDEESEGVEELDEASENKSNLIVNKINSDLKLDEQVKYFNGDDTVGTGPHPPVLDKRTSYKVYWEINNNLHELEELEIRMKLPKGVSWNGKERSSIAGVEYDEGVNEVVWYIGRLPVSVYKASAEFSVSITPTEDDVNRIMILLPGTEISANDIETESLIEGKTKTKTTKLEDDEVIGGDGIVQK